MRRLLAAHCAVWCMAAAMLGVMQPFISTHFRWDGWEDEPSLRIFTVGQSASFEQDDRPQYSDRHETTLFVSPSACLALPDTLALGLAALMAALLLAIPLLLAPRRPLRRRSASIRRPRPASTGPPVPAAASHPFFKPLPAAPPALA